MRGGQEMDIHGHCHWRLRFQAVSCLPRLYAALGLASMFMMSQLIGGYLSGSLAIMSDAAHMLSDCVALVIALLAVKFGQRKPTNNMSYGYKRSEVVGALISVLLIWIMTGILVYLAIKRLVQADYEIQSRSMIIVATLAVVFNIVLAFILHNWKLPGHGHSHGEPTSEPEVVVTPNPKHRNGLLNGSYTVNQVTTSHSHSHSHSHGNEQNINIRAAFIHVIGDLIQSLGVLVAAVIIEFYPQAKYIDPLCTFAFSCLVMVTTFRVTSDGFWMIMQAVPKRFRYSECLSALRAIQGVKHVHSVHAWALSTNYHVFTAHIAVDENIDHSEVLNSCQLIARDNDVYSATFQIEKYQEAMESCDTCQEHALL